MFSIRKTTEQFIIESIAVHGNKYDYSKVDYKTNKDKVCIICPIHGEFWQNPKSHIQGHGCRKCYQCSKHKYGVATYDVPDSCTTNCYITWRGVLERTIGTKYKSKYHTYKDCTVCDEWLIFSNFQKWFYDPANGYIEGYHLDKDLITKGNKHYSPSTCCFLPPEINTAIAKRSIGKTKAVGVIKNGNKYESSISKRNKRYYLGIFNTLYEAFQVYKIEKESYLKELAKRYFKEGKITETVHNALMKYEVGIDD